MSGEVQTQHVPFGKWLRAEGIPFTYHDPTRPTGATLGDADFVCYGAGSKCIHVEFKTKDGRLSTAQAKRHAELAAAGCLVHVCRSLDTAIELVRAWRGGSEAPAVNPSQDTRQIITKTWMGALVSFRQEPNGSLTRITT